MTERPGMVISPLTMAWYVVSAFFAGGTVAIWMLQAYGLHSAIIGCWFISTFVSGLGCLFANCSRWCR